MQIALVSFFAVTNIVDKILTECVERILFERGHIVRKLDLSARSILYEEDDEEIRIAKKQLSFKRRNDRKLFANCYGSNLKSSQLVIFAGGVILNIFVDTILTTTTNHI